MSKLQVLHRAGARGFSDNLHAEFASYECRKLLKHLIALRGQPVGDLKPVAARLGLDIATIERYFAVLEEMGCLNRVGGRAVFTSTVDNLGPTVEWYVAYLFNRKLHWQATTNVLLEDNKDGDFDVLAVLSSEIAYVECKTSAPDQIPNDDLVTFLNRRDFLEPAFALLLVDTSSSVQELANRLDDSFWKRQHSSGEVRPVTRVRAIDSSESVFANGTTIYVGNANAGAANGLLRTLQLTLRHYSTRVRGNMVLAGE